MFDDEAREYAVVRNAEDQYSIWPTALPAPAGWFDVGHHGPKGECLAYISGVWTDLRPASSRRSSPATPS
jgi:MbtH protein